MNVYKTDNIRNVVLLGHGGSGKTSMIEAMAYGTKITNRIGKVSDGNTEPLFIEAFFPGFCRKHLFVFLRQYKMVFTFVLVFVMLNRNRFYSMLLGISRCDQIIKFDSVFCR